MATHPAETLPLPKFFLPFPLQFRAGCCSSLCPLRCLAGIQNLWCASGSASLLVRASGKYAFHCVTCRLSVSLPHYHPIPFPTLFRASCRCNCILSPVAHRIRFLTLKCPGRRSALCCRASHVVTWFVYVGFICHLSKCIEGSPPLGLWWFPWVHDLWCLPRCWHSSGVPMASSGILWPYGALGFQVLPGQQLGEQLLDKAIGNKCDVPSLQEMVARSDLIWRELIPNLLSFQVWEVSNFAKQRIAVVDDWLMLQLMLRCWWPVPKQCRALAVPGHQKMCNPAQSWDLCGV